MEKKVKITNYNINTKKIDSDLTVACVSDLHSRPCEKIVAALKSISPDIILLAGDIFEIITPYMSKRNENASQFIKDCLSIPLLAHNSSSAAKKSLVTINFS